MTPPTLTDVVDKDKHDDRVDVSNLFHNILPASAMGIQVVRYDGTTIIVTAPIALNTNDKGTTFAGSLYSALVLSGWALFTLLLRDREIDADVVVAKTSTEYKSPVVPVTNSNDNSFFECHARLKQSNDPNKYNDSEAIVESILQSINLKGRAKVEIESEVRIPGSVSTAPYVTFNGLYVASLRSCTSSAL